MISNLRYLLILVSGITCFIFSCKEKVFVNEPVIIEGQVENVPDGKLYLVEKLGSTKFLDSAVCKDGHFRFQLKTDSSFAPFIASIVYPSAKSPNGKRELTFRVHSLGKDSLKNFSSFLMVEKGLTRIEGDVNKEPQLRVFGSPETDVMYSEPWGFGWLPNTDSARRQRQINYYRQRIAKRPASYYLLESLYNSRTYYSESEIADMLKLFRPDLQQSSWGKRFQNFFADRNDFRNSCTNLLLQDATGQSKAIIDTAVKLNILVFWASWCGPCRMEIPVLKEVYKQYGKKDIRMVSISIDDRKDYWQKALNEEKMPWEQLNATEEDQEKVQSVFSFSAIPVIVFIDKAGKEVKRFVGYDEDGLKNYKTLIEPYIHSQ